MNYRPVALFILDGWGIREFEHGNATAQAEIPNVQRWLREHERAVVDASGRAVGLPDGQMGNSEVGHLNLGAGRVVYQDIVRIDLAIEEDALKNVATLADTLGNVKQSGKKLHLIGLLGTGGVHSHSRHLFALLDIVSDAGIEPLVHVITDGRDTPPTSAEGFVAELEEKIDEKGGHIASLTGRYYTMDRDKRWERTRQGFDAIAHHEGRSAESASDAIKQAYADDETDEFIKPFAIGAADGATVEEGDTLLFVNFRADRMRQIVKMFLNTDMGDYELGDDAVSSINIITMTQYENDLAVDVLFEKKNVERPLAQVISEADLKQFHTAETEKYAHVTYFFNGGIEEPFPNEVHEVVPSPKVATYDLQPEMNAHKLADKVEKRIREEDDAFILVNFANPDMVGHTGDLGAAIKAVETTDECAGRLVQAIVEKGGVAIVTADHGNCEIMEDEITGEPHTYHTTNPVSLFVISDDYFQLRPRGILADVAPTVLDLLGVEPPEEMTGQSLIVRVRDA